MHADVVMTVLCHFIVVLCRGVYRRNWNVDKMNITVKAKDSICNQGIDKYLFIGAFYIVLEVA